MIGVVVITHGRLAGEIVDTVRLIMGQPSHLEAVSFSARESLETLRERAREAIEGFTTEDGCLILTDLFGGSATNITVEYLKSDKVRILTGVNLPMVMEALQNREKLPLEQLAVKVRDGAIRGIIDLKEFFAERAKKKATPA